MVSGGACGGHSSSREIEQLEGELDAALVFASAAEHHSQNGNVELAEACRSDAADGYARVMAALGTANLTGAQVQDLKARLVRLRHVLDSIGAPNQNRAA